MKYTDLIEAAKWYDEVETLWEWSQTDLIDLCKEGPEGVDQYHNAQLEYLDLQHCARKDLRAAIAKAKGE